MTENNEDGGPPRSGVAVVVSGGGARGAYEAGVLSVLLPALAAHGARPDIFLGTSAGAINAVGFASLIHLDPKEAAEEGLKLWRATRASTVFRSPIRSMVSRHSGPRRATSLLDSSPLVATLSSVIDWDQLHDNVARGLVSVGVVATAWSTRRSTVFLERAGGAGMPDADRGRAIDYVATTLTPQHVQASAAIPMVFPAVQIDHPASATDWYIDGGLRMNTPLKPALSMRARRMVVIATDPAEPAPIRAMPSPDWAPDVAGGAAQVLYALLTDRMVEDLRTLARKNMDATGYGEPGHDAIEWLFAGPEPGVLGPLAHLAGEVLQGRAKDQRRRGRVVELLRRSAGSWMARNECRLEVLTMLLFDPDFIDGAIELGRQDALRSLHESGRPIWQLYDGGGGHGVEPELAHHHPTPGL